MKHGVILAVFALLTQVGAYAAEEKSITTPFPKALINPAARVFYCDAAVGTILMGAGDESKATSIAKGLTAVAHKPTDRVVLVLEPDNITLSLFNRIDFEGGRTDRNTPYQIVDGTTETIVAVAIPRGMNPTPVGVITLNRKSGIGSLTDILSNESITANPRIESMYVACGPRRG